MPTKPESLKMAKELGRQDILLSLCVFLIPASCMSAHPTARCMASIFWPKSRSLRPYRATMPASLPA